MDKLQRFDFQQSIEQFLEQNQIYELFEGLLKDLVANRPDQPLDYLIQKLSKARGKFIYVLTVTHLQPRDCSLWDPPAV
jgi:hypothetical protein